MSCGAFGGIGSCGGGGGGGGGGMGMDMGMGMNMGMQNVNCMQPRRFADRGFFDPFCLPRDNRNEQMCYFNPFIHAQCLGVDMNMQGFRKDILKCQENYKKAVWAVLKKYAVGEAEKTQGTDGSNSNTNNISSCVENSMAGFGNWNGYPSNNSGQEVMSPEMAFFYGNQANAGYIGFPLEDPHHSCRGFGPDGMDGGFRTHLPPI